MIIHIDAFTYSEEWDETMKEIEAEITDELEEIEEIDDLEFEEIDEEYYNIIELDSLRMPTFLEMIKTLIKNPHTLFILWLEDEETKKPHYIMKDTYEHCLGFLDGIKYCGQHTGVQLSAFMDLTKIRVGLLAANTFIEVNKFFDYEVFNGEL